MVSVTPGDVALVDFPFSAAEAQPFKRRPVLVLAAVGRVPDQAIWVVMITGKASRYARPGDGDVRIPEWAAIPLHRESVVRSRRVWTAEERDIVRVLGRVSAGTLDQVRAQIADTLDMTA